MEEPMLPIMMPAWAMFYCKIKDVYCLFTGAELLYLPPEGLKELVRGITTVYKDSLRIKEDDGECPIPNCPDRGEACEAKLSRDDEVQAVGFVEELLSKKE